MKTLLLPCLLVSALTASAQFTPITDDFSTAGTLVGSTPDSGVGAWTQISSSSPALAVSTGTLGLAASSGESAQLNFATSNLSSGTIYMGWDFTVSASGSISTSDSIQAVAGFRSGTASSGAFELSFGIFRPSAAAQSFSGATSTTTSQVVVGVFSGTSLNASTNNLMEWSSALNRGAQYRAVLGLDLVNDEARLWIAPASEASTSIALGSTAAIRGVFFRQGAASHGVVSIDNLVVSQDFASAAAIPEPSSFAPILALCAFGAASLRRRRSNR